MIVKRKTNKKCATDFDCLTYTVCQGLWPLLTHKAKITACPMQWSLPHASIYANSSWLLKIVPYFFKFYMWRIELTNETCKKIIVWFFWRWRPRSLTHTECQFWTRVTFVKMKPLSRKNALNISGSKWLKNKQFTLHFLFILENIQ